MPSIKILALAGSLRPNSSSHVILKEAGKLISNEIEFQIDDSLGTLPHFDGREEDAPEEVQRFRRRIREANGILICTPEYAFGIPGSLKNALDWTVGTGDFVDKPVSLITASSQGEKGHEALQWVLKAISARLHDDSTLLISFIRAKIKDGELVDAETKVKLEGAVDAFIKRVKESC